MKLIKNQAGFSLMEIMIAITLIAVLGTFVVGKFVDRLDEGNVSAAKIQINNFNSLLEDYRRYCNQYPTTQQGLEALVAKPSSPPDCPNYPASAFVKGDKLPKDPWGLEFAYESPDDGKSFVISSLGKDRKEGGEGVDKDIRSNEL